MKSEQKRPLTYPSLQMFAPYRQTIRGFLIVSALTVALIVLVQLLMWIK